MARKKLSKDSSTGHFAPDNKMEELKTLNQNLKTLNQMLAKETMEKRFQIENLKSELEELSEEKGLLFEIERRVSCVVVSSAVSDTRRKAALLVEEKERRFEYENEGLRLKVFELEGDVDRLMVDFKGLEKEKEKEKEEMEKRFEEKTREYLLESDDLRERMRNLEKEKDAIENAKAEKEVEIFRLEQETTKNSLRLLDFLESQKRNGDLEEEVGRVMASVKGLEKEKEEKDMRFEAKIKEYALETADLRERIGVLEREKDVIEEVKANQEVEILGLEQDVMMLSSSLLNLKELETKNGELEQEVVTNMENVDRLEKEKEEKEIGYEAKIRESALELEYLKEKMEAIEQLKANQDVEILRLQQEVTKLSSSLSNLQELEKRNGVLEQEIVRHLANAGRLEKEKEEKEMVFNAKIRDSALELDDLKEMMLETEQAKVNQEADILELKKEVSKLNSSLTNLKKLTGEYLEKIAQLQAGRDAAQRELDIQREEVGCLKLQVDMLTKSRDGTFQELKDIKSSFNALITEKEEGDRNVKLLSEEKSLLEKSLSDAEAKYHNMEEKMRVTEDTPAKTFSLLKDTVEAMNGTERTRENGAIEVNKKILPFIGELEKIKTAHSNRVTMVEEMKRELEVMKSAMDDALKKNKKKGLWMWLYPATTTFVAAISVVTFLFVRRNSSITEESRVLL